MNILNIIKEEQGLQFGGYVNPNVSRISLFVKCLSKIVYKKCTKCKPTLTPKMQEVSIKDYYDNLPLSLTHYSLFLTPNISLSFQKPLNFF